MDATSQDRRSAGRGLRNSMILIITTWIAAAVVYVGYYLWGEPLIESMYFERSLPFLNRMISGRDTHTLDY